MLAPFGKAQHSHSTRLVNGKPFTSVNRSQIRTRIAALRLCGGQI
jgi:hypothetical protein